MFDAKLFAQIMMNFLSDFTSWIQLIQFCFNHVKAKIQSFQFHTKIVLMIVSKLNSA